MATTDSDLLEKLQNYQSLDEKEQDAVMVAAQNKGIEDIAEVMIGEEDNIPDLYYEFADKKESSSEMGISDLDVADVEWGDNDIVIGGNDEEYGDEEIVDEPLDEDQPPEEISQEPLDNESENNEILELDQDSNLPDDELEQSFETESENKDEIEEDAPLVDNEPIEPPTMIQQPEQEGERCESCEVKVATGAVINLCQHLEEKYEHLIDINCKEIAEAVMNGEVEIEDVIAEIQQRASVFGEHDVVEQGNEILEFLEGE